jgi:hypothetical protein
MRPFPYAAFAALPVVSLLGACGGTVETFSGTSETTVESTALVTVLVRDPNLASEIAVSSTALFWVDRGETILDSIHAIPIDGGPAEELYVAADRSAALEAIAADGDHVYWTEMSANPPHSEVKTVSRSGGPPQVLATDDAAYFGIAESSGYVYFGGTSGVKRVPVAGGEAEILSNDPVFGVVLANTSGVFWIDSASRLMGLMRGASVAVVIGSDLPWPGAAAAVGPFLFWGGSGGEVRMGSEAGEPGAFATGTKSVFALAADDAAAYWIDGDGPGGEDAATLNKLSIAMGAKPEVVARGIEMKGQLVPQGLALDAKHVYWASDGEVVRAVR